jgi:hypothetical protein
MRTLMVVAAALIAVTVGVWSTFEHRSATETRVAKASLGPVPFGLSELAPAISAWEMHNQAHLENLPIQEVEDQTFIFTAAAPR